MKSLYLHIMLMTPGLFKAYNGLPIVDCNYKTMGTSLLSSIETM